MSFAVMLIAVEIAVAGAALLWIAKVPSPWLTGLCAALVGAAAACSLGLAIHISLMQATGFGDELPYWLAPVSMIFGLAGFAVAGALRPSPWIIGAPCVLVVAVSLADGLSYGEPLGGVLGIVMLITALASSYCLRKWMKPSSLYLRFPGMHF